MRTIAYIDHFHSDIKKLQAECLVLKCKHTSQSSTSLMHETMPLGRFNDCILI